MGSDSPVNDDWEINKSFADKILTSAGIISPAAKWTISPTTISDKGISCNIPLRSIKEVVWIIWVSFDAEVADLCSWIKWIILLKKTITKIIVIVIYEGFSPFDKGIITSTIIDIIERIKRIMLNKLKNDLTILFQTLSAPFLLIWFLPNWSWFCSIISSSVIPRLELLNLTKISSLDNEDISINFCLIFNNFSSFLLGKTEAI